jgi:hypothetical protein
MRSWLYCRLSALMGPILPYPALLQLILTDELCRCDELKLPELSYRTCRCAANERIKRINC